MENSGNNEKIVLHGFFNVSDMLKYEKEGRLSEYLSTQAEQIKQDRQQKIATVDRRYAEYLNMLEEAGCTETYKYVFDHPEEVKKRLCYTVLDYMAELQQTQETASSNSSISDAIAYMKRERDIWP